MAVLDVSGQACPIPVASAKQAIAEEKSAPSTGEGLVIAIGSDSMGRGNEELGKILIKGFIFSLSQLEIAPKALLFFNSGVLLTVADSNTLGDLQNLATRGTTILICGTCADYYKIKEQVSVGEISNMYSIVETMSKASNVINL